MSKTTETKTFKRLTAVLKDIDGDKPQIIKTLQNQVEYLLEKCKIYEEIADQCPLKDKCRSQKSGKQNRLFKYGMPDLRSRNRRKKEATAEFKKEYRKKRCSIEGLNGRLKQFTPLRRLRVRGRSAVYHSIYAILIMHNISKRLVFPMAYVWQQIRNL